MAPLQVNTRIYEGKPRNSIASFKAPSPTGSGPIRSGSPSLLPAPRVCVPHITTTVTHTWQQNSNAVGSRLTRFAAKQTIYGIKKRIYGIFRNVFIFKICLPSTLLQLKMAYNRISDLGGPWLSSQSRWPALAVKRISFF